MADAHVDYATGSDSSDGSAGSPFQTLGKAISVISAGENIWVIYTHNETVASVANANLTYTFPSSTTNPVKVFSVDTLAGKVYRPGAKVTFNSSATADWVVNNGHMIYGFTFDNDCDDWSWGNQTNEPQFYRDCTFSFVGTGQAKTFGNATVRTTFINCTFEVPGGGNTPLITTYNSWYFNCTFTGSGWTTGPIDGTSHSTGRFNRCYGCDFSGLSSSNPIVSPSAGNDTFHAVEFYGCTFHASAAPILTPSTTEWQFDGTLSFLMHSVPGTISAPAPTFTVPTNMIDMTHDTTVYRSGGATQDGSTYYTWKFTVPSGTTLSPLGYWTDFQRPICTWVTSGSKTLTLKFCSEANLALDKRSFWLDILSPNETANPNTTSKFRYQTTRDLVSQTTDLDGTAASFTTGSSGEWTGSGPANYYEVAVTINPAVAGPVHVFIRIAAQYSSGARSIWLDPTIIVT